MSTLFTQRRRCHTLYQKVHRGHLLLSPLELLVDPTSLLNSRNHSLYLDRYQDLAVPKVFHHMTKLN